MLCSSMRLFNKKLGASFNQNVSRQLSQRNIDKIRNDEIYCQKQVNNFTRNILLCMVFALFKELITSLIPMVPKNERKKFVTEQASGFNKWTRKNFNLMDRIM